MSPRSRSQEYSKKYPRRTSEGISKGYTKEYLEIYLLRRVSQRISIKELKLCRISRPLSPISFSAIGSAVRERIFVFMVDAGKQAKVSKISVDAKKCTPIETISTVVPLLQCIAKPRLLISPRQMHMRMHHLVLLSTRSLKKHWNSFVSEVHKARRYSSIVPLSIPIPLSSAFLNQVRYC